MNIEDRVIKIIDEYLYPYNIAIKLTSLLGRDLCFDSYECFDIISRIEDEFQATIGEDDAHKNWKECTVQDIINQVEKLIH